MRQSFVTRYETGTDVKTQRWVRSRGTAVSELVDRVADALKRGRLVALPTETVYGLGANMYDERAVQKIYEVKGRPQDNPMIVHVGSMASARQLMQEIPPHFQILAKRFWPGPLTLVVPRNVSVPDVVTAGLDTVALRMPAHALTLACIRRAGVPVAAPSANLSGRPSPTTADMVWNELNGKIFAVLDGGACSVGIESAVLDLTSRVPTILRPGSVTREDIEDAIQAPVRYHSGRRHRPASPGMKYLHYAPSTPLVLVVAEPDRMQEGVARVVARYRKKGLRIGLMGPARFRNLDCDAFVSLGKGTAVEYARGIYHSMRMIDDGTVDVILCPGVPESGLGFAVMNRLRKAATRILFISVPSKLT